VISVEAEGLDQATKTLEALKKIGDLVSSAEIRLRSRNPESNTMILAKLAEEGRDFISLTDEECDTLAKIYAARVELGVNSKTQTMDAVIEDAWVLVMERYKSFIVEHIERGKSATGSLKDLSSATKQMKTRKWGFAYPIGKASGELIEAIKAGKIVITKKH
jgi:viroplasmin and RNaseH domain-containing protein